MTTAADAKMLEILLVDDDAGDVRLTAEAIRRNRLRAHLSVASNGDEAIDFLHKRGRFASAPTPDLVFLDLNMPRKDGREVLAELKNNPKLKHIPVVVLTTSDADEDILQSYQLHANCYITKPADLGGLMHVFELIGEFWFTLAKLPHHY